jgi:hypothetical protein
MKTFFIGDFKPDSVNDYTYVDDYNINQICQRNIGFKTLIINVSQFRLDKRKIEFLCKNSLNNIVFVFNKIPDYKIDGVEFIKQGTIIDDNLFKIIEMIMFEKDRNLVLNYLNKLSSIPYHVILKWLYGTFNKIESSNLEILDYVDNLIYKYDKKYINILLSKIEPQNKPKVIWQFLGKYRYKKVE